MNRRKLLIVLLAVTAIVLGYFSYFAWSISGLAGFAAARFGGGKREGRPGRVRSIIIPWRRHELHLHHWFLSSLASLAFAIKGFYLLSPELFFGFLGGLAFQGIYCYNDWHRILRPRVPAV